MNADDLKKLIDQAVVARSTRPKGVRLDVESFVTLEKAGHIQRKDAGPLGIPWHSNVPFYDDDIYAWCDPSFEDVFELPPK